MFSKKKKQPGVRAEDLVVGKSYFWHYTNLHEMAWVDYEGTEEVDGVMKYKFKTLLGQIHSFTKEEVENQVHPNGLQ